VEGVTAPLRVAVAPVADAEALPEAVPQ